MTDTDDVSANVNFGIIILIPIIGAFYALKKTGFNFLNFIYPLNRALNTKISKRGANLTESKLEMFEDMADADDILN